MKIEITLKDNRYCCDDKSETRCPCYDWEKEECKLYEIQLNLDHENGNIFRLEKCIKENGL